jgi:hypothetical protein
MIPAMSFYDVVHIAWVVLGSLGGGGMIVYALSSHLGKMWADRALEKQKQEYTQQNIALQGQVTLATQTVGHLQKLSGESTFNKIAELWKALVLVETAFRCLPRAEHDSPLEGSPSDVQLMGWRQRRIDQSIRFVNSVTDATALWRAEMLFFPVELVLLARAPLLVATDEQEKTFGRFDPFETVLRRDQQEFFEERTKRMVEFTSGIDKLLPTLRQYLQGKAALGTSKSSA